VFVVAIPLFWNPVVRKELLAELDVAPGPLVRVPELVRLVLITSAVELAGLDSPVKSHFTRSAACKAKGISELARKQDMKRLRLLVAELMSLVCFMAVTQLVIDNEFWSTEQK
jgi:hypothetical protein